MRRSGSGEKGERWRTPNDSNNDWDAVVLYILCALWLWQGCGSWLVRCEVDVQRIPVQTEKKKRIFSEVVQKENEKEDIDLEQIFLPLLRQRRMTYQSPAIFRMGASVLGKWGR